MRIGFIHGRIQPFHKSHLSNLLYVINNYDEVWVGISNPLRRIPNNVNDYPKDVIKSVQKGFADYKNIFTYRERQEMIVETLRDKGVDLNKVQINPYFPFCEEKNWEDMLPKKELTTIVMFPKDPHHNYLIDGYKGRGWKVEIVKTEMKITGTMFHEEYPDGNWQELVPDGTRRVIENKLDKIF